MAGAATSRATNAPPAAIAKVAAGGRVGTAVRAWFAVRTMVGPFF